MIDFASFYFPFISTATLGKFTAFAGQILGICRALQLLPKQCRALHIKRRVLVSFLGLIHVWSERLGGVVLSGRSGFLLFRSRQQSCIAVWLEKRLSLTALHLQHLIQSGSLLFLGVDGFQSIRVELWHVE